MSIAEERLYDTCRRLGIAYHVHEHSAVFTVEESTAIHAIMPGAHTKNLFLKDKHGKFWLLTLPHDKRVDLKTMATTLGAGKFSFAKSEDMQVLLGVKPGSVTPLVAVNAPQDSVIFVLDDGFDATLLINVHPLRNTATIGLFVGDLIKLIKSFGHSVRVAHFDAVDGSSLTKEL